MIKAGGAAAHCRAAVQDVDFRGARAARPTQGGARRDRHRAGDRDRPLEPGHLDRPDPGRQRDARTRSPSATAPVVAVSPLVGDEVVKGPTAAFMDYAGLPLTNDGIATCYDGSDRRTRGRPKNGADVPVLETDVLMATAGGPPPRGRRDTEVRTGAQIAFPRRYADGGHPAHQELAAGQAAPALRAGLARPAGAGRGDVRRRARGARAGVTRLERVVVVSGDRVAQRIAGGYGATRRRGRRARTQHRGGHGASNSCSRRGSSGPCSSPATARCSRPTT